MANPLSRPIFIFYVTQIITILQFKKKNAIPRKHDYTNKRMCK